MIHQYPERYGDRIVHGEAEYNVEGLIRLAGWNYDFTTEGGKRLRYVLAKSGERDRDSFLTLLNDGKGTSEGLLWEKSETSDERS